MVELVRSGSQWVEVGQPLFGNVSLSIGSPFIVSRSRTNHDPAYHTGPEWFQTDPDDLEDIGVAIEDCPGDVNDDRLVDVSDLLAQRSQRGDCAICTRADVDGNRAINTGDLLELLARWGPCD